MTPTAGVFACSRIHKRVFLQQMTFLAGEIGHLKMKDIKPNTQAIENDIGPEQFLVNIFPMCHTSINGKQTHIGINYKLIGSNKDAPMTRI